MHISSKPLNKYPWYLRLLFWFQKRRYGQPLEPALMWARVPKLFIFFTLLFKAFRRKNSPLSLDLRSLVSVRVSQLNWCSFCIDMNSSFLQDSTDSMEKVSVLDQWKVSKLFSDKERVALEYAQIMSRGDGKVSEDLMSRLKDQFSDDALVELTGLIAFQNMSAKFNAALDIPPHGFCRT